MSSRLTWLTVSAVAVAGSIAGIAPALAGEPAATSGPMVAVPATPLPALENEDGTFLLIAPATATTSAEVEEAAPAPAAAANLETASEMQTAAEETSPEQPQQDIAKVNDNKKTLALVLGLVLAVVSVGAGFAAATMPLPR